MDTEDRDNERGGEDDGRFDNVVQLPRDWLGPRSELVPIGSAADRADAEKARGASGVTELTSRDLVTQDDFWGGELDSIPRPVVAPRAHPVTDGIAARCPPVRRRRAPRPSFPPIGRRAVAVAAGLAGTVAAAVAFGVAGAGSGAPQPLAAATPGSARALIPAIQKHEFRGVATISLKHGAARQGRVAGGRVARTHHARPPAPHADAGSSVFVRSTARTSSSSATASSGYVAPVSSEPITRPATTSGTASKSSAQSGTSKPGPVGAGAPIAPGTLG